MLSYLDGFPKAVFALGLALLGFVVLRERPRALAAVWVCVICFVPWWTGINPHSALSSLPSLFFPAASVISIFALLCLQPAIITRWTLLDWLVMALGAALLLPTLIGGSTTASTFGLLGVWAPGYLVGRSLGARLDVRWIYGCVAVVFTIVSGLALLEYLLAWNPFQQLTAGAGPSYSIWGHWEIRGGRIRAEGAFGDPIALATCVALAIPMTLASRLPLNFRVLGVALMLGASAVSFSRTGMLSAALGLGLSIVFLHEGLTARARAAASTIVVVVGIVVVPLVTSTFAAAGSEAAGSANYRLDLTSLIPRINLVGLSDAAQRLGDGRLVFGQFKSIDSQLILLGLTYGGVSLIIALVLLVAMCLGVLLGRATAPTIALAAQIPSLATVALITQYSVFFLFVAGLAVATQVKAAAPADPVGLSADPDPSPSERSPMPLGRTPATVR